MVAEQLWLLEDVSNIPNREEVCSLKQDHGGWPTVIGQSFYTVAGLL